MKSNNKTILIILAIAILTALVLAIWMPQKTAISNLDFSINDSNENYHFEVDENLKFSITDSLDFMDRDVIWYMGNGDTIMRAHNVDYSYNKKGKYRVTLKIDDKYEESKYIEVISVPKNNAKDSIPVIHGVDTGYVGEELAFTSYSPGVKSWYWSFGETGTTDAYKGHVIYTYKTPGIYNVKLKTNTSKYPVSHLIKILPLFDAIDESKLLDSLSLAEDDIKKRLQTIADASINNKIDYYKSLRHIENRYTCNKANEVIVVVNEAKYNDLYSYCQGLHYLEGIGEKSIIINEVALDTFNCIKKIKVTQSIINR